MKTLVVYTSQTGFTKKYAQWLSERMSADLFDVKDVQKKESSFFDAYEAIVYAGWFMAGKVVKANWFLDRAKGWKGKHLAVVAVGAGPVGDPHAEKALQELLSDEQRTYIKTFYCQGGINYEKMNLPSRLVMKAFANSLKKSKDEKQRELGETYGHSFDQTDVKYIQPIVEYLMA